MPEELQCPFCGGVDIRFTNHGSRWQGTNHGRDIWSTCCYACGARFANMYDKAALEAKWRQRPKKPLAVVRDTAFFNVTRTHGELYMALLALCVPGRVIRWKSSGAEYGLFEATVVAGGYGEVNVTNGKGGQCELYYEQVAEIQLTPDESNKLGLGFPT